MNGQKKKLWFAMLLVFVLVVVTACSGNNNAGNKEGNETPAPSDNAGNEQQNEQQAEPVDPLGKYEETVEVTYFLNFNSAMQFPAGEDAKNNIHTRLNKEHLNLVFNPISEVDITKFEEKVNLAIASNQLPDVFKVKINQLQQVMNNGQAEDLTEVFDQYASPELKRFLQFNDSVAFKPATQGGKIYGLPLTKGYAENIPLLWIRKDWLANVNMEAPKTIDELLAVAKAFVEQDPDKNSKKDTIAIGYANNYPTPLTAIAAAFGGYPNIFVKDSSGKLVYGSVQPEVKTALGKMQELYKMGAFDKEYAIKDHSKMWESVMAGKTGIYIGPFWSPIIPLSQTMEQVPTAEWDAYTIPGISGEVPSPQTTPLAEEWVSVRKGFEHPEALIKAMNLWVEMSFGTGPIRDEWTTAINGAYKGLNAHLYSLPYFFDSPDGFVEYEKQLTAAKKANDGNVITDPAIKEMWDNQIVPGGIPAWTWDTTYTVSAPLVTKYPKIVYSAFSGAPTSSMVSKGASLATIETEMFTEIIMGGSLDKFEEFIDKYYSLGGKDIENEVNEWASKQ